MRSTNHTAIRIPVFIGRVIFLSGLRDQLDRLDLLIRVEDSLSRDYFSNLLHDVPSNKRLVVIVLVDGACVFSFFFFLFFFLKIDRLIKSKIERFYLGF